MFFGSNPKEEVCCAADFREASQPLMYVSASFGKAPFFIIWMTPDHTMFPPLCGGVTNCVY